MTAVKGDELSISLLSKMFNMHTIVDILFFWMPVHVSNKRENKDISALCAMHLTYIGNSHYLKLINRKKEDKKQAERSLSENVQKKQDITGRLLR